MNYRLEWRLVGRASQLLDEGEIDEAFPDRTSALQALNAFLLTFAVRGRNEAVGYWWGRRSTDADIEVQVVLRHPVLPMSCAPAPFKLVASQDASSTPLSKPVSPRGEENDIRGTDVTAQGRHGPHRSDRAQAEPLRRVARRPGPAERTSRKNSPGRRSACASGPICWLVTGGWHGLAGAGSEPAV